MPNNTGFCVLSYFFLTLLYSLWAKKQIFVDVIFLSLLFTLRIFSGAVVSSITMSSWLVAFSLFIFLGLGVVKRQKEVFLLQTNANMFTSGMRPYKSSNFLTLTVLAVSSALISMMIFVFYIRSEEVLVLYSRPSLLWPICLLLTYWLGRMIFLAYRGIMDDDPVLFALRDKISWIIGIGILTFWGMAIA